jgi:hypothetical protein
MHSLLAWTQQTGREAHDREPGDERDWSGALTLLCQAAEAIQASADASAEARARGLLARATEEIQRAQVRIGELEARLQGAEARASAAEARVKVIEAWFQRAREAIATELSAGMNLLDRGEGSSEEPGKTTTWRAIPLTSADGPCFSSASFTLKSTRLVLT